MLIDRVYLGSGIKMSFSKHAAFVIAGILAAASAPTVLAQQNPDTTPAATAPASAPAATLATPSEADETAALIAKANAAAAAKGQAVGNAAAPRAAKAPPTAEAVKKAREYGFHAEVFRGKALFCREDATVGTRIKATRCIDADQFEDYAVQLQIARDTMKKDVCQGGNTGMVGTACGGLK
jgi:hypothetical protein